jgi:transcription initiation factor IIF auxiliary subunit
MNPTYELKKVETKEYPYLISRTDFGKFVIGVEVHFKIWTTLKPVRIDHLLKLEDEG